MAEKEYTVVAPDGKEITLIGPAGASHEEVIAQAQKLYNQPKTFVPTEANRGNIINTDVPTVVGTRPNAVNRVDQKARTLLNYATAIPEVALAGVTAIPSAIAYGNVPSGSSPEAYKQAEERAAKYQYTPTNPVAQDVLETIGEAAKTVGLDKLPPYIPGVGQLATATKQAGQFNPLPSYTQALAQKLAPETPKGTTVVSRYKEAFTPEVKPTYATAEQLESASKDLFKTAKESGLQVDSKNFAENMKGIVSSLEQDLGYDPELYPKIDTVVKRLTNPEIAKDFNKLKSLRTMIGNLQATPDRAERKIATQLKYDFDNYLASLPEEAIIGGSKEGATAWKEARNVYSRLSKSQIFEDMLETAKLEKGKYSQAGIEQSLYNQLKNLAKNDKRMRMFTPEEQVAIKQAAEGSDIQNVLKFIGKFAPTSTVSSILPLLVTGASAPAGILGTAAAIGARAGAAEMRKRQIENLANLMRGTVNPEWQKQPQVNPELVKMLKGE